jgi:hypothetical protein
MGVRGIDGESQVLATHIHREMLSRENERKLKPRSKAERFMLLATVGSSHILLLSSIQIKSRRLRYNEIRYE